MPSRMQALGRRSHEGNLDARNHGVNASALREAKKYGANLTLRQIIRLKQAGVHLRRDRDHENRTREDDMKHSLTVIALGVSGFCAVFGLTQSWDDEWRVKPSDDPGKIRLFGRTAEAGEPLEYQLKGHADWTQFRGSHQGDRRKGRQGEIRVWFGTPAGSICEGILQERLWHRSL